LDHRPEGLLAIEDSANGLAAADGAALGCVVTLSDATEAEPLSRFHRARAVLNGLGDGQPPVRVLSGPPCREGKVTLAYLQGLMRR
jgi:beta-phosphoglucomutase-like phosphatase (HAD superfamily)